MIKTTMIRISQKSLSANILSDFYSALEGESIAIKRIFDPRYSLSGDDLIIEGEIDNMLDKLSQDLPRIVSLRFQIELNDYYEIFLRKSAMNLEHKPTHLFFGSTLVDYKNLQSRLRITDSKQILALLFKSQLGSKLLPIMPVKIKGLLLTNSSNGTVDFVLPTQRIATLKEWLTKLKEKENIDFDILADIFKKTDPIMRKNMSESMDWLNLILPEIVAKSASIENINIVKAYEKTLSLI